VRLKRASVSLALKCNVVCVERLLFPAVFVNFRYVEKY